MVSPSAAEGLRYPNQPLQHRQRLIPIGPWRSLHVIQLGLRVCASVYSCYGALGAVAPPLPFDYRMDFEFSTQCCTGYQAANTSLECSAVK